MKQIVVSSLFELKQMEKQITDSQIAFSSSFEKGRLNQTWPADIKKLADRILGWSCRDGSGAKL